MKKSMFVALLPLLCFTSLASAEVSQRDQQKAAQRAYQESAKSYDEAAKGWSQAKKVAEKVRDAAIEVETELAKKATK